MAKKNRVKRPKGELENELRDQISLMKLSCDAYDRGMKAAAKHLALNLRVLLYHHGNSNALLQQLGLRSIRFLDSAGPVNPKNVATTCNLIVTQVGSDGAEHIAAVEAGGGSFPGRMIRFSDWWFQTVSVDNKRRTFNRKELVMHVADTDGGAHVDPDLDEAYLELSRNNALGWVFNRDGENVELNNPVLPCIRQIAHEVLTTLEEKAPEFFSNTTSHRLDKLQSDAGNMLSHSVTGISMDGPQMTLKGENGQQTIIDFAEDASSKIDERGNKKIYKGNISERNDGKGWAG
jgi:hypothetical protein